MTRTVAIQELELPRNAIVKLIKNSTEGKLLQKDAKTAVSRAATYFVSYLTATAQEQATAAGQKTVGANHLYTALEDIGWSEWIPLLRSQLEGKRMFILNLSP